MRDNRRVELRTVPLSDFGHGFPVRQGRAIRAFRGEGIVDVGYREESRPERDVLTGETSRIAHSVETLVMGVDHRRRLPKPRDATDDVIAHRGMFADFRPLVLGQAAGLQ